MSPSLHDLRRHHEFLARQGRCHQILGAGLVILEAQQVFGDRDTAAGLFLQIGDGLEAGIELVLFRHPCLDLLDPCQKRGLEAVEIGHPGNGAVEVGRA